MPKKANNILKRIEKFTEEVSLYIENNPKYSQVKDIFINYWTETNKSNTKFRFEAERFFSLGKRLGTFLKNAKPTRDNY